MSNDLRFRASLDDKVSSGLDRIKDKANALGGQGTAQSLFGNVGAKAAAFGLGLVEGAAQSLVGALGDVIQSGIQGEQSQSRLLASLKANIPAFDGNTAAIDKAVVANQNLGFSDDETKDSLTRLVAATHDVNAAIKVQSVAMDLARFKGISLQDATDALTKIEAGRFRGLADLGIQLRKGATEQEALTAVEKVAQGQAADYANTVGGKLLVAQTKFGDAMQHFGETILPLVADGLNLVSGAADVLNTALDNTAGNQAPAALIRTSDAAVRARHGLGAAHDAVVVLNTSTNALATGGLSAVRDHSNSAADAVDDMTGSIKGSTKTVDYADRALRNYLDLLASGAFGGAKAADIVKAAASDLAYAKAHPGKAKARAGGGPVESGEVYTVGENRPETLVMYPGGGGYVYPTGGRSGGGGTVVHTVINLDGRTIAEVVDRHLYYEQARAPQSVGAG